VRRSSIFAAGALVAGLALGAGVAGAPSAGAAVRAVSGSAASGSAASSNVASNTAASNTAATSAATAPAGSWGPAQAVPGSGTMISDVSCAPGGACVAVGDSFSSISTPPAFMIIDQGGYWGKPQQVPGLASLGSDSFPSADDVACPAKGDCLVAGEYGSTGSNGFVVEEINGTWGKAIPIPGLAALDTAGQAAIDSVSCPSAGNCTVAGDYAVGNPDNPSSYSSFVVDEVNYKWGTAQQIPGLAALNVGGDAEGAELTCRSPQNCTVVGVYQPTPQSTTARSAKGSLAPAMRHAELRAASRTVTGAVGSPAAVRLAPGVSSSDPTSSGLGGAAAYVASEVNGVWVPATAAPAIPGQTASGLVLPTSTVACTSAGNCVAAGLYAASDTATTETGFLLTQSGGSWTVSTALHGMEGIFALACPSAGNCVAGGLDTKGVAAVLTQSGGAWGTASELKGATGLTYKGKKAQESAVESLACPRAGNCTAAGAYVWNLTSTTSGPGTNVFVATEVNGAWSSATAPTSITTLNSLPMGDVTGVSCAGVATCAVTGMYATSKDLGSFVLAEIPLKATSTAQALSVSKISYGKETAEHISVHVTATSDTPGGKVTVKAGSKTICVITLKSGKGSCTLTAKQLAKGTYHLQASYPGQFGYGASASKLATLTVVG
jgi:hypothetical protein